jgi:hypothetical protein
VVVVAEARVAAALDGLERSERGGQPRRVALRLHGEQVAGEEHEVGVAGDRAGADGLEAATDMKAPMCGSVICTMRSGRGSWAPRVSWRCSDGTTAPSSQRWRSSSEAQRESTSPTVASAKGSHAPQGWKPSARAMDHGTDRNDHRHEPRARDADRRAVERAAQARADEQPRSARTPRAGGRRRAATRPRCWGRPRARTARGCRGAPRGRPRRGPRGGFARRPRR